MDVRSETYQALLVRYGQMPLNGFAFQEMLLVSGGETPERDFFNQWTASPEKESYEAIPMVIRESNEDPSKPTYVARTEEEFNGVTYHLYHTTPPVSQGNEFNIDDIEMQRD